MIRHLLTTILCIFCALSSAPASAVGEVDVDAEIDALSEMSHAVPWQEAQVMIDLFRQSNPQLSAQHRARVKVLEARVRALAGDVDEGLTLLNEALELGPDSLTAVLLHSRAVNLNVVRGDYVNAFRQLLAGQERLADIDDPFIRSHFLGRAAFLYRSLGQHERGEEFAVQAVEAARQTDDPQRLCDDLIELTSTREASYPPADLEAGAREALAVCEQAASPVFAAVARQMIGTYLFQQDRLDEAIPVLRKALSDIEATGFADGILETRLALTRALLAREEDQEAEILLLDLLPRLAMQRRWRDLEEANALLAGLAESRGNHRRAVGWQRAAEAAQGRKMDHELAVQAAYHQAQFERLTQDQTLALLEEERRRDALIRNRALVGSGFLLLLILLVFNRYRLKQRSQQAVERHNRELETLSQVIRQVNQKYALQEVLSPLLRWALDTMTEVDYGEMLVRDWRHRRFRVLVNAGTVARPIVATPAADDGLLAQINASRCLADGVYLMDSFTRERVQSEPDAWPSELPLVIVTIPGADEIDGIMLFGRQDGRWPGLSNDDVDRLKRIRRHVTSALGHSQQAEDLHVEKHRATRAMSRLRATAQALEKGAEEAERANQEKAIFLSRISHELRTPLHAIIGYSQKLGRGLARHPDHEGSKAVEHIRSSGQHLLSLIESLMDLSSIEGQHNQLQSESIHLSGFVEDTAAIVRPQLEANGNRLHVYCDSLLDEMETDPVKLRQILFNLLSNSAKFTQNGHVELNVQPGNRQGDDVETVQFQVRDSGIGISQSQQEQIFDPFHRGDDQQAGQYSGTGLGLSVTRSLCESLGGEISVSSRPGQGSLFLVTLPRTPGDSMSASEQDQLRKALPTGPRLLVVEDNRINRELMLEYLRMEGFELLAAEDGQSGLEMALAHCPDLILMDLNLPRLSGIDAVRMIRADVDTGHIPIIAVSADASRNTRDLAMKAGCDAYEVKPVDFPGLVTRIRSALQ